MTNASAYGLEGVLPQQGRDGIWQPISFTTKELNKAERNYALTETECLAVLYAMSKW